jgi:hypothetical protein
LLKSYSNNSVNQKISHITSLFNHLHEKDRDVDPKITKLELLPHDEINASYGSLSKQEVDGLIQFAGQRDYKPEVQQLFFETLFVIAIRQNFIFKLKWEDIKLLPDRKSGKSVWTICQFEKGKYNYTALSDEFYNKLCTLKNEYTSDSNYVFAVDGKNVINEKTVSKTLKDYCESVGIGEDRKIKLHSIKKSSGDFVFSMTSGDILATARHLKNRPETAMNFYLGKNRQYADQASYNLFNLELDYSVLDRLSKEELIEIIKQDVVFAKTLIDKIKGSK